MPNLKQQAVLARLEAAERALVTARGLMTGRLRIADAPAPAVLLKPEAVYELLREDMEGLAQEQLRVVLLTSCCTVLETVLVYQGTVDAAHARAVELLRPAILLNAPFMILVHNHPSGDPSPSAEDVALTQRVVEAGRLLDIEVVDHIIIGAGRFVSLKERGLGWKHS